MTPTKTDLERGKHILDVMERVILEGDLSKLTPQERLTYYGKMCESLGLNPLTKPFQYIVVKGKLTLYATKDCTEQLRKNHKVSIYSLASNLIGHVYVVTAAGSTPDGRQDSSTGAVDVDNLKGEELANAYMKAETKAKRRLTLSLCGLGIVDESEIDSIKDAIIYKEPDLITEQQVVRLLDLVKEAEFTDEEMQEKIFKPAKVLYLHDLNINQYENLVPKLEARIEKLKATGETNEIPTH